MEKMKNTMKALEIIEHIIPIIKSDNIFEPEEIDELYKLFFIYKMDFQKRKEYLNKLIDPHNKIEIVIPEDIKYKNKDKLFFAYEVLKLKSLQNFITPKIADYISIILKSLKINKRSIRKINNLIKKTSPLLRKLENEFSPSLFNVKLVENPTEMIDISFGTIVPLLTLYFSGSIGLSAIGITSGLAALGSGIILSPMAEGIILLIIIGLFSKKFSSKIVTPFLQKYLKKIKISTIKNNINKYEYITNMLKEDTKYLKTYKFFTYFSKKEKKKYELYKILRDKYNFYKKLVQNMKTLIAT